MTAIPTGRTAPAAEHIPVWDLPTRVFHWALAGLLLVCWFTGEDEGASLIHRVSGEVIAGLIVFRVIWGFIGGEHARFRDFLKGPSAVARHLGELAHRRVEPTLGHNPLGGLSVLLLLASASFVVVTGLFSAGDEGPGGPLAGLFGWEMSGLHEPAFRILQGVVLLHLAGVVLTSIASRDNLVKAMITGSKRRPPEAHAASPRRASIAALLVAAVLGASCSAYLISRPHPVFGAEARTGGHGQERAWAQKHEQD